MEYLSSVSSNLVGVGVSLALIVISIMYLVVAYKAEDISQDFVVKSEISSKIKYGWISLCSGLVFLVFFAWKMNVRITF